MGSEWPSARLADYCLKIGSGATPKGGSNVYLDDGDTYLIRSQNVYNNGFSSDGLVFITEEAALKLKNVVVEENDILLNITGDSVARVCLARPEFLPARVNQHVLIVRTNPDEFDPRFVRYFLSSPLQQQILLNLASSGATRNALTKSMIENYEVPKPPLNVQASIADQLEMADKKIQLNRQTNQTLEQMAQALFKSWFVDFDPVIDNALLAGNPIPEPLQARAEMRKALLNKNGDKKDARAELRALFPSEFEHTDELGWVPKGWVISGLDQIISIKHGYAFKGEDFSDKPTKEVLLTPGNVAIGGGFKGDKFKYYNGPIIDDYVFNSGDLYVNMTDLSKSGDTLGYPAVVPDIEDIRFHHNQRLGKVIFNDPNKFGREFVFRCLCSNAYRSYIVGSATGTTVKHTSPTKILEHKVLTSSGGVESILERHLSALSLKKDRNEKEIRSLSKLRDTLLPKLISGELRLPDVKTAPDELTTAEASA